ARIRRRPLRVGQGKFSRSSASCSLLEKTRHEGADQMRRAALVSVLAAVALAVAGAAAASTTSSAKHLRAAHRTDHGGSVRFADDNNNELELQAKIVAVTPATATTPGSLTVMVGGQSLVIPLPAGTMLAASFVAGATVEVKVEVEQAANDNRGHGHDGGGDDD